MIPPGTNLSETLILDQLEKFLLEMIPSGAYITEALNLDNFIKSVTEIFSNIKIEVEFW